MTTSMSVIAGIIAPFITNLSTLSDIMSMSVLDGIAPPITTLSTLSDMSMSVLDGIAPPITTLSTLSDMSMLPIPHVPSG
jgi:hypothetical protein